jgi:hypothetical protein
MNEAQYFQHEKLLQTDIGTGTGALHVRVVAGTMSHDALSAIGRFMRITADQNYSVGTPREVRTRLLPSSSSNCTTVRLGETHGGQRWQFLLLGRAGTCHDVEGQSVAIKHRGRWPGDGISAVCNQSSAETRSCRSECTHPRRPQPQRGSADLGLDFNLLNFHIQAVKRLNETQLFRNRGNHENQDSYPYSVVCR